MPKLTLTEIFQRFRGFVLVLSGVHTRTLDLVPSERPRFESLGWSILITSGIATVSMWFALSSAMGVNGIIAIPPALLWGLVIMGIDRWLITSMPSDGARKFAMAVPRFALALLLGTLISTPFVLRVFQAEINAQIAVIQQKSYNNFLQTQQNSLVAKQVSTYRGELQQLNTVITSHGAQTGNTAADPQLVAFEQQKTNLNNEVTHWATLKTQYYNAYICQLYGGPTCPKKGNGPAAQASHKSYLQASNEVTNLQGQINTVQGEIQARDNQLNSNSKADQLARYNQAVTALPLVQNNYNTAVQRQGQLQSSYYAQEQANHGILMRLEALSQLSNGNFTVTAARFLLFLLFLVIECLPVTVKLLQRPGLYEESLLHARAAEREDVQMFYNNWSGLRPQRVPAERAPAVAQEQAQRDRQEDVRSIWTQTRAMPRVVGHPDDERVTEVHYYESQVHPERPVEYPVVEYPPAEADPRPAHGWGKSAGAGQPDEEDSRDKPQADEQRFEETVRDPWAGQTRPDVAYQGEPAREDVYQPEHGPGAASAHRHEVRSEHDALAEMDDEPASARPAGNGIPLSWDDDE
jgi:hypothetical protein